MMGKPKKPASPNQEVKQEFINAIESLDWAHVVSHPAKFRKAVECHF